MKNDRTSIIQKNSYFFKMLLRHYLWFVDTNAAIVVWPYKGEIMTIYKNLGTATELYVFLNFIHGNIYLCVVKHAYECLKIKIKNK